MSAWLKHLPRSDPQYNYIIDGVTDGFDIIDDPYNLPNVSVENYNSATNIDNRQKTEDQILYEISNGRYHAVQTKPRIVSALGVIPKGDPTKVRLIHDCSRPSGAAVNDFAANDNFKFQSIQNAVDIVKENSFMAKIDLSNAYRSVKIKQSNYQATGLQWTFQGDTEPTFLVDTRLPFGASKAPYIFNELTQAVRRIMANKGFPKVVVYLDDFFIEGSSYNECNTAMHVLLSLLRELGFAINYSKVCSPTRKLVFLGIVLNTTNMTLSLPAKKLADLHSSLIKLKSKSKVTKRELQSVAGKLNWASQCVYGGRFHLRRIIDRINTLKAPWHRTRITRDMRADIDWWLNFMDYFNGTVPMVDPRPTTPVFIDACPVAGGGYHNGQFVYTPWSSWGRTLDLHINHQEVMSLEPAVVQWGSQWRNKKVLVHCDNQAAVAMINKGSSSNPVVMDSLRRVFWWSALFNFRLKAIYIPGSDNNVADAVSRLLWSVFEVIILHSLSTILYSIFYILSPFL